MTGVCVARSLKELWNTLFFLFEKQTNEDLCSYDIIYNQFSVKRVFEGQDPRLPKMTKRC